jgi:homoserine kinase
VSRASAFAPGSIGNVGPGFDVLGLAIDGIGDTVTVELTRGPSRRATVSGRDATLIPQEPERNCAVIAAVTYLRPFGYRAVVHVEKGLPLAGGMGGSAASSVAGAFAAALALGQAPVMSDVLAAAFAGESAVAGRHLDNIAASAWGGLTLSLNDDPIDIVKLPVSADWWLTLVTPQVRISTREARALLPPQSDRALWVRQMARTTAVANAFAVADDFLLWRALDDRYAEPHRAALIPHFAEVKQAALEAGAFGCSISGAGPTIFAISADADSARSCGAAMQRAFRDVDSTVHVGPIAKEGVRSV